MQFFSPTNICWSQGNIPCPLFAHVLITAVDFGHREVQQTPVWPFHIYVDTKSATLNIACKYSRLSFAPATACKTHFAHSSGSE